eukprot:6447059-Lingulodinium_polyedra.AAC.1
MNRPGAWASQFVSAVVALGRCLAADGRIQPEQRKGMVQLPPLPREVMMGPKDVSIGQVIIVGASGSRFYTAKGAVGPMPRLAESLLFRDGGTPF